MDFSTKAKKEITLPVMCSVMSDSLQPCGLGPLGFSVHGICQARILEWDAISFSGRGGVGVGSFKTRDRTCTSCLGKWVLYHYIAWEALYCDGWALIYGCPSVYHVCHMSGHTWKNDKKCMPDCILWAFVPKLVTPKTLVI